MDETHSVNGSNIDAAFDQAAGCITEPTQHEQVSTMVRDLIEKVADKWTMLVLETLEEHGRLRFTQLRTMVEGVSQKMLTKTLRQMECDGFVTRIVHPVIPPHVEYELTDLGLSLGEAFCPLWRWVQAHHGEVEQARRSFARQHSSESSKPAAQ